MEMMFWDFCGPTTTVALYYLIIIGTAFSVVLMSVVGRSKWAAREKKIINGSRSMIEELVPEIMTEVVSYLDYASLCKLSITNSLMHKTANDDYTWKALYHKDFWDEEDDVVWNGWKGYYAATRAVVNLSAKFHNIIRQRNISLMREMWLNADYVKCIQPPCHFNSGYDALMQGFERLFGRAEEDNIQQPEVKKHEFRARVKKDVARVTVQTFLQGVPDQLRYSNVFEYHNGRWYMVLHHASTNTLNLI